MKIAITKKIGKSTLQFQVDGERDFDALFKAALYTTMPDTCGVCSEDNLVLDSNKTPEYKFVKIKCLNCRAQAQLGQYKDGTGYYWNKFEEYVPKTEKNEVSEKKPKMEDDKDVETFLNDSNQ